MVRIVNKMTNEYIPYTYLILLGLFETADIIYDYKNNYVDKSSTIADKEEQRKSIFKDLHSFVSVSK